MRVEGCEERRPGVDDVAAALVGVSLAALAQLRPALEAETKAAGAWIRLRAVDVADWEWGVEKS